MRGSRSSIFSILVFVVVVVLVVIAVLRVYTPVHSTVHSHFVALKPKKTVKTVSAVSRVVLPPFLIVSF